MAQSCFNVFTSEHFGTLHFYWPKHKEFKMNAYFSRPHGNKTDSDSDSDFRRYGTNYLYWALSRDHDLEGVSWSRGRVTVEEWAEGGRMC